MKIIKLLWQKHRLLLLGFSLATLVTVGFLTKFTISLIFWSNNRDVTIEPWMPIGYIARSYEVDRNWLFGQTGLAEEDLIARMTIEDAAKAAGITYLEMQAQLLAAIEAERAE